MSDFIDSPHADSAQRSSQNDGVSEAIIDVLRGTKNWVGFVGVIFLLGTALMVLSGFGTILTIGATSRFGNGYFGIALALGSCLLYVLMGLIYGALGLYLVRYAKGISLMLEDGQLSSLENALQQQRKFWRLAGWLIAVSIPIMIVTTMVSMYFAFANPLLHLK